MSTSLHRPLFIVLEGLDGAGKSTCARALAGAIGADLMTTPAPAIRECRTRILDSFDDCQEAGQLFYLSTVFAASKQVRAVLAAGRSVIMDRYFLSTQAYAEFRGSRLELDMTGALLLPADLTVYLDARMDVRERRLRERGCTADDNETLDQGADDRLRELHRQKSCLPAVGQWMEADNSGPDPAPLVRQIVVYAQALSGARP